MRVALSGLDAPAMLVDLDGTVLDTNDEISTFGFRRSSMRGRPLWSDPTWGDLDPAAAIAPLVDRAGAGEPASRTVEAVADGRTPLRLDLSPVIDADGDVVLVLAELHRLSDRIETDALIAETNERLAAAEDIFQAVAEYTSDLVCLHRPDGTYTYVSPSVRRLLDLDPATLGGTHPAIWPTPAPATLSPPGCKMHRAVAPSRPASAIGCDTATVVTAGSKPQ